MVIKKVNKIKTTDEVRQAFIFAFTLLQNSCTLIEFEQNLQNMFILFNSEFENDQTRDSLLKINSNIRDRKEKLTAFILNPDAEMAIEGEEDETFASTEGDDPETISSIKKNSPFTDYFALKHASFSKAMTNVNYMKLNAFYKPELYSILSDYLHIIPLWTGIGLSYNGNAHNANETVPTRLSNNPVERWFGISKYFLFLDMNLFPNAIAIILYENVEANFKRHYVMVINKELLKSNKDSFSDQIEIWNRGDTSKYIKGFYFNNEYQIKG
jgi:hypothetical protein